MPDENLFLLFQKTRDKKIRDKIITKHLALVYKLAKRYAYRGTSLENLVSIGTIGLITAVDNFDVSRGVKFTTYGAHCILGEIKKSFRDNSWKVKVPRRLKEMNAAVQAAISTLTQKLERSPTIEEVATQLNVSQEAVIEAIEANHAYSPISLDATLDIEGGQNSSLYDILSVEDQNLKDFFEHYDLDNILHKLVKREQIIIHLFYYEEFSQAKIAQRLSISQMHVSRLLRQAISNLKKLLTS